MKFAHYSLFPIPCLVSGLITLSEIKIDRESILQGVAQKRFCELNSELKTQNSELNFNEILTLCPLPFFNSAFWDWCKILS